MCFVKRRKKKKTVGTIVEVPPSDHVYTIPEGAPKIDSLEEFYCYNNPECDVCNLLEMAEIIEAQYATPDYSDKFPLDCYDGVDDFDDKKY